MSQPLQQTLEFARGGQNYRDIKAWLAKQSDKRLLDLHNLAHQKMSGESKILIFDEQRGVDKPKLVLQSLKMMTEMQKYTGPLPTLLKQVAEKPYDKFGFLLIRVFLLGSSQTEQIQEQVGVDSDTKSTPGKRYAHSYTSCSFPFVTEANHAHINQKKNKGKDSKEAKESQNKEDEQDKEDKDKVTPSDVQSVLDSLPADMSSLSRLNALMDHFTTPIANTNKDKNKEKQKPIALKTPLTGLDVRELWTEYCNTYIWLCDQKAIASQTDWLYS